MNLMDRLQLSDPSLDRSVAGAKRRKVPTVDSGVLVGIFQEHKELVLNQKGLGEYERISRTQAVSGNALAECHKLLRDLLVAQPGGELAGAATREAMCSLLQSYPKYNQTKFSNAVYAGLRFDRVSVMLNHLRRLKNDAEKRRQCCATTSGAAWAQILDLLLCLDGPWKGSQDLPGESQSTAPGTPLGSEVPPTQPYPVDPTEFGSDDAPGAAATGSTASKPASRKLQAQLSLDADGFPKMLGGSSSSTGNKRKASDNGADRHPTSPRSAAASPKGKAKSKAAASPKASPKAAPSVVQDYTYMYYKGQSSMGIRQKRGQKKQVFSFRASSGLREKSPDEIIRKLTKHAKACIIKLLEGQSELQVAAWARDNVP